MTDFDPQNHEHDEDGNCLDEDGNPVQGVAIAGAPPEYSLSVYDLVGVGIVTVSNIAVGVLAAIANGATIIGNSVQGSARLISTEFFAAANYERTRRQEAAHRRLLADDLASLESWQDGEK